VSVRTRQEDHALLREATGLDELTGRLRRRHVDTAGSSCPAA